MVYTKNENYERIEVEIGNHGNLVLDLMLLAQGVTMKEALNFAVLWKEIYNEESKQYVEFFLPSFKLNFLHSFKAISHTLDLFEDSVSDLSNVFPSWENAFLQDNYHFAQLDVHEHGVGSVSGDLQEQSLLNLDPHVVIKFDRPFLFTLRDKTSDSVLVQGYYAKNK